MIEGCTSCHYTAGFTVNRSTVQEYRALK